MNEFQGFPKDLFKFFDELKANNNRDWFQAHKEDYAERVQEPARAFIRAIAPRLSKISPHIVADDRKVGGSMMRIHRDVRFSKDKRPYDPRVAMRFMHEVAKKKPAPGFYIRINPSDIHLGAGATAVTHDLPDGAARHRRQAEHDTLHLQLMADTGNILAAAKNQQAMHEHPLLGRIIVHQAHWVQAQPLQAPAHFPHHHLTGVPGTHNQNLLQGRQLGVGGGGEGPAQ